MTGTDALPAPVLTIAGGAGAMGSLFAELLLPRVRACLLVDLFPSGAEGAAARTLSPAPLVERLGGIMARGGLDGHLLALPEGSGEAALRPLREARTAPAWLLFHPAGAPSRLTIPAEQARSPTALLASLPPEGAQPLVGILRPEDAAAAAAASDVLLIATPYLSARQFETLIAPYLGGLRPGALVADLLSIKEAPLHVLDQLLPPEVGLLGTHPLFGRVVGDVTGLVVALTPVRGSRAVVPWQSWLLRQLADLGMLLSPTSAAEHDAAMSYVQALSHFALLSFAYTFVRANQDPTQLLPYRTPVFEPLLYLAARVAAQAQRTPDVYRAIQAECARPEVRRLFIETAAELLAAIEAEQGGIDGSDRLGSLFQALGAPWSPSYHQHAEPYEHLVAMSNTLIEPINALRHELLQSAGKLRALRNSRTGAVTIGALYVDQLHHDRVDLASRVRFHRFNLADGTLVGADAALPGLLPTEQRRQTEAALSALPLAQVQLLSEAALCAWLTTETGPRSGPDDRRGPSGSDPVASPRPRYVGKAHYDLSLLVPAWFDDDCLSRLLTGRGGSEVGLVTAATLAPQEWRGLAVPPGLQPVVIRLVALLLPEAVHALRQAARQQELLEGLGGPRLRQRQREDRLFAAAVGERHLAIRQQALDWLLAHGCRPVVVAPSDQSR